MIYEEISSSKYKNYNPERICGKPGEFLLVSDKSLWCWNAGSWECIIAGEVFVNLGQRLHFCDNEGGIKINPVKLQYTVVEKK
jgi:hypothetical protein